MTTELPPQETDAERSKTATPPSEPFRIAVVLPVYNTERYLSESLDSLRRQTHGDFAVFCVDDASTDGSLSRIERFAAQDPRFHVLHLKQNGGISTARNRALELVEAQDDFKAVYFFDSDDRLLPDALARMAETLGSTDADYAVFGWLPFDKKGPDPRPWFLPAEEALRGTEPIFWQYLRPHIDRENRRDASAGRFLGNKVFRASSIRGLRFDESMRKAEDVCFWAELAGRLEKGILVKEILLDYRLRSSSSFHSSTRVLGDIEAYLRIRAALRQAGALSARIASAVDGEIVRLLWISIKNAVFDRDPVENSRSVRRIYRRIREEGVRFSEHSRKKYRIYELGDWALRLRYFRHAKRDAERRRHVRNDFFE